MTKPPLVEQERIGKHSDWQLYRRLLRYVLPYWYLFAFSILGYVVYSVGNVLLADLMQFLLDSLNDSEQVESGIVAGAAYALLDAAGMTRLEFARIAVPVAMVTLAMTRALGYFAGNYFMNHVARNLIHELRQQLFNKMLLAPSIYYDRHSHGVLISKITFNVEQITGAATKALKVIVGEGLTVVGLLGYMLYLAPVPDFPGGDPLYRAGGVGGGQALPALQPPDTVFDGGCYPGLQREYQRLQGDPPVRRPATAGATL